MARSQSSRRRWTMLTVAAGIVFGVLAGTSLAWAVFSSYPVAGVQTNSFTADSLPQGQTPGTATLTAPNANTVIVSFTQVSTAGGVAIPPANYVLKGYPSVGSAGIVSATCSGSGTISCTTSSLANATWQFTDTPTYDSWVGMESAKSPSVTVNSSPTASPVGVAATVTYTNSGITWVNKENVTLTDAATDTGGPGISSVIYYYCATSAGTCTAVKGTEIGSSATGSSYSVPWASSALPADGTYNVIAVVTDNSSNSVTSSPTEIGIDTTAPTVSAPIIGTAANYYSNGTTTFVNNGVLISDTASDGTGSGVASVTYYYCAVSLGSCTSSNGTMFGSSTNSTNGYQVSWTGQPSDAAYRVVAVSVDNVANSTTSSATAVSLDNTAPTVPAPIVNGYP